MKHKKFREVEGAALIIVLALVVLLVGLVVAFMERSTLSRQLAQGSYQALHAEQLGRSALEIVAADLRQEIFNAPTVNSANVLPQRSGTPAPAAQAIPNLIRISFRGDATSSAMPAPGVPSRASAANSVTPSLNGRLVTAQRWNRHYLIPRANTGTTIDSTPVTSFNTPDWVMVTPQGPQVISTPSSDVIGRYAYGVYDEGGLLDVNVAAFPFSPATPASAATPGIPNTDVGRKGNIAFADFTALPTVPTVVTTTSTTQPTSWNTATNTNTFVGWRNYATVQPGGNFNNNFTFDAASSSTGTGARFLGVFLSTTSSFLGPSTTQFGGRSDQIVNSRGQLLDLRSSVGFSQNILQYLGTFSRDTNLPTWGTAPTRLNRRFPLSRFDVFSNPSGNASDIQKYFGIRYIAAGTDPEHWQYYGALGSGMQSSIATLTGTGQDPDLSVLLRYVYPTSVSDGEILSIIASLIDQRDSDPHTTWIEFGDSANPTKAFGADSIRPTNPADPWPNPSVILKRPFRNVGELGYAFRNASTNLDFFTAGSNDSPLLDLFTYNTATVRAGLVNLNSGNIGVVTALLTGATTSETSSAVASRNDSFHSVQRIVAETTRQNATSRSDVSRLVGASGTFFGSSNEAKETVARALAEVTQTRTWNLLIDVIAQTGKFPSSATTLDNFVVQAEKRYWLHIAIDRFTGEVIDRQFEAVYE